MRDWKLVTFGCVGALVVAGSVYALVGDGGILPAGDRPERKHYYPDWNEMEVGDRFPGEIWNGECISPVIEVQNRPSGDKAETWRRDGCTQVLTHKWEP